MSAVSVIMLSWNHGPWLGAAIESILGQSMSDLELLVVDNGSTDGSLEDLLARKTDVRLSLVRHATNRGIPASYNAAMARCTAPWIALMDGDDLAHPMRLELQLKSAAADPLLDVIGTGVETIDEKGRTLGPWPGFYTVGEILAYAPFGMPVANPTLFGRTEVMRKIGFREQLTCGSDYDFVLRALEAGRRIGAVSLPLYYYRRHLRSATIARSAEFEAYTAAIRLCAARRRAGRPERFDEVLADMRLQLASAVSLSGIMRYFARQCRREGFALLAALHAALAIRAGSSAGARLEFLRCLLAAARQDRGATGAMFVGAAKGPFWVLLERGGFPARVRY